VAGERLDRLHLDAGRRGGCRTCDGSSGRTRGEARETVTVARPVTREAGELPRYQGSCSSPPFHG
jgi:hypothetical protein